ncbi:hypothetical protein VTO73DRAFT_11587 [Trametes versicolor]
MLLYTQPRLPKYQEMSVRIGGEPEVPYLDRNWQGTWQFMSVKALQEPRKKIGIPDELESAFNVLLYCAIRYLPHNCDDVGRFMHKYFDDGEIADDEHTGFTSGMLKTQVIESGRLSASNHVPIVFLQPPLPILPTLLPTLVSPSVAVPSDALHPRAPPSPCTTTPSSRSEPKGRPTPAPGSSHGSDRHPIDHMLQELLLLFQAFYEYQQPPRPKDKPIEMSELALAMFEKFFGRHARDLTFPKALKPDPSEPSKESIALQARVTLEKEAQKLTTHDEVVNILHRALHEGADFWPDEDKQADQLYPVRATDKNMEPGEDVPKPGKRIASHNGTSELEPDRKRARTGAMS